MVVRIVWVADLAIGLPFIIKLVCVILLTKS